jgi:hypothetical protein
MLLHRRPREVYRVYSEDEYLNGAGSELGGVGAWRAAEPQIDGFELGELLPGESSPDEWPTGIEPAGEWATAPASDYATKVQSPEIGSVDVAIGELYDGFAEPRSKPARERRLRRVAGVAVLAGAIGTVGGLVVLNLTRANGGEEGRRGGLVAATRSSRAERSLAVDDAQPQVISSRAALVRSAETARPPRVPQIARRGLGRSLPRRSGTLDADRLSRGRGDVAVAADHVPRRSSGAGSAAVATAAPPAATTAPATTTAPAATTAPTPAPVSVPAPASTTTASAAPPAVPPAPENRSEFGFER